MTTAPSSQSAVKVFDGNREILLGARLGAGADGAVYRVAGDDTACIKIFDPAARSGLLQRLPRIQQLVRLAPALGANAALPTRLVAEKPNGPPIGFGMKRIEGTEVHNLYGVSSRQVHFPGTDFRFLVQAAKNAAIATARLHKHKVVIGDISGRNLMVRKDATVCWIDSDSFLLGASGFHEVCPLVTPEWTAPELQQDRHRRTVRLPGHDAFGLAVMIFHLLMLGRHPFQGRFTGNGEAPGLPDNIGNRWYAHAGYAAIPLRSPVGTPPVAHLGPAIEQLFLKAFLEDRPDRRPSADDWVQALQKAEASLRRCRGHAAHFHFSAATSCPWCAVLPDYGNIDPFEGVVVFPCHADAGGAGTGNLGAEITAFIASLAGPASIPTAIYRPTATVAPVTWSYTPPGWLASWLSPMLAERARVKNLKEIFEGAVSELEARLNLFLKVQQDWLDCIAAAAANFTHLQGEAADQLAEKQLRGEAAALLGLPQQDRERRIYLARFRILIGEIPGIGPKRVAELAGHGITTAADLEPHRIAGIPGFGEALTDGLMEWRKGKERGFRPSQVNASAGAVEHRARQLLAERKKEFTQRWVVMNKEIRDYIQGAKDCAAGAVKIQKELDATRANAIAAAQALARLGGP